MLSELGSSLRAFSGFEGIIKPTDSKRCVLMICTKAGVTAYK